MKANRSYRLLYTRASRLPARIDPTRIDHLEVVEIASGEVVLFWDLAGLDVEDFVDRWCAVDS